MSKAEKTREFIIKRSAPVFNIKGYAGTSLSDLIEITGLTKGAIYGNFENKDEVAIAVFQYNIALLNKRLDSYINDKETATEKLFGLTKFYRENWKSIFERGGCPILNAAIEADDNLPVLKKYIQNSIQALALKITQVIEEGKKSGEFKTSIVARNYAYTIITIIEGGIMLGKILNNHGHLFSALDRIELIINNEIKK